MTPNINPNPTPDPRQGVSSDITRLNRQGIARDVEHAREAHEAQRETAAADTRQARRDKADRVDLSKAARTYGEAGTSRAEGSQARGQRVEALRAAYEDGTLNSAARIESAAANILLNGDV